MAEAPEPVGSSFKPYVLATAVKQGMDVQNSILNGYSPIWIPPDWTPADRQEISQPDQTLRRLRLDCPSPNGRENTGPLGVAEAAAISSDPAFEDLAHRVGDNSSTRPPRSASARTRSTPTALTTSPS